MDSLKVRRNTPWLDMPLVFSGNYREYECTLDDDAQCAYQQGYWRFWYEADHRYALPTIAFFLAVIAVFSLCHVAGKLLPRRILQTQSATRTRAIFRYLSYRTFRIPILDWNSAPIGILMLSAVGIIFFSAMVLGPKPYYWPNTDEVDYGSSPPIATRAGWLSLACMPFVFATAGKVNFITFCTGVSHERLQVFHRWISYAFFILALIHTFPFIVYNIDMHMMVSMWEGTVFYWTGTVALIAQAWLTFASFGPFRSWNYEWFKFSHFVAGLVFTLFLFFHCDATLSAWDYFLATGVLFLLSWLARQIRVYFDHGINHRAELSLAKNGFIEVRVPTNVTWTLGQHFFVRFMALGIHAVEIHPFTACSLPRRVDKCLQSELLFFIRPRRGLTARLAKLVESRPDSNVRVLLDGPYGGVDLTSIRNSQRILVIAGGSGAGWALPFITAFPNRPLPSDSEANLCDSLSMKIILVTRDSSTTTWFEEEAQSLRDKLCTGHNQALEIEIYYTQSQPSEETSIGRDKYPQASVTPENHGKEVGIQDTHVVQLIRSRPDLSAIVANEAQSVGQGGSMSVFVCGPLSMQNDVSDAVAREQLRVAKTGAGDVLLHLEHFSWA